MEATTKQPLPRGRQSLERIDAELRTAAKATQVVLVEYQPGDSDETKTYKLAPYSYRGDRFFGYDMTAKSIKAFKMLKHYPRAADRTKDSNRRWPVELAGEEAKAH